MKLSKLKSAGIGGGAMVKDPRFMSLHSDPRFQRIARRKLKVEIDERFHRMFSDKTFVDPLAQDKRGRPKTRKPRHFLHHFYTSQNQEDEEEKAQEEEKEKQNLPTQNIPSSQETQINNLSMKKLNSHGDDHEPGFISKQLETDDDDDEDGDLHSSSSSSSSSSSEEESGEEVDVATQEQNNDVNVPTIEKETSRLALVNMDWTYVKATDILVLMNSFVPKGGCIKSVSIYPSEFGLEQMREELIRGPQRAFESKENNDDDDGDAGDDEVDMDKLRQYEKDKLRYYYAVVECDNSATADFLYKSCDGMEFERTSNILDLRFIPDDTEFKHSPRDVATEVPANYEAPYFETRALQHSKVKLTWDDDEPVRIKTLHRSFKPEQLNEMDFKAYLASEEDEDSEEEGNNSLETCQHEIQAEKAVQEKSLREKYLSLILGSKNEEEERETGERESDKEMEVTFYSGLDDLSKRLMEKKKKQNDGSVWEAYLRKKKEKKRERKKNLNDKVNETLSSEEEISGDNISDPFVNTDEEFPRLKVKATRIARKDSRQSKLGKPILKPEGQLRNDSEQEKREEERRKAELELLLADEYGTYNGVKGYNLKKQRFRGKEKEVEEEKLPKVDFDDPRFSALFTSHHFAIDPTDPKFKRSNAQLSDLVERQRKHFEQSQVRNDFPDEMSIEGESDKSKSTLKKRKLELSTLVQSLKRKVQVKAGPRLRT